MRKFILIKKYPDCGLELQDIITFEDNKDTCFGKFTQLGQLIYGIKDCIDYPEFWQEIKVRSEKILTTEDGIDIFDKDQILYNILPKAQWTLGKTTAHHAKNMTNWKIYADKYTAIEYIVKNKPVLTYNEVIAFCDYYITDVSSFRSTLKDLIKQKLKL